MLYIIIYCDDVKNDINDEFNESCRWFVIENYCN